MSMFLAAIANPAFKSVKTQEFSSKVNAQEWLIQNEIPLGYSAIVPYHSLQQKTGLLLEANLNSEMFFKSHQEGEVCNLEAVELEF